MAIDCEPCNCPDAYYKDSMSWRWATLKLLCEIDELLAAGGGGGGGGLAFVTADAPLTGLGTAASHLTVGSMLTALSGLDGSTGLLRQTGALTFTKDSSAYITSVVADAPLSGAGTSASHLVVDLSSKQNVNVNLTSISGLPVTVGLVKQTAANTFGIDVTAYATTAITDGKVNYHGIEAVGAVTFDNTTRAVTIAAGVNTYWYKGTKYTTASAIVCDLDLVADRDNSANTLTANKLYYFYFKDATGKLYWSDAAWNFREDVFVCTVYWNGSAGALQKELHDHTRNIDWHIWAHDTIGTRYESGFTQTNPTTVNDALLQIETGTIHDEDQEFATGQMTTMRAWYPVSASVYTFADYSLPYVGTAGVPQYLRVSDYTLQNVGNANYACYWVYTTLDTTRPLYMVPTIGTFYNSVANARLETAPILAAMGLNSEWKLIYRFIYKGDGNYQESADYRGSSSLPAGGIGSIAAGSVSFSPVDSLVSTNVQSAIAELAYSTKPDRFVFSIGDGVNVITAGLKKCIEVQENCTINTWTLLSDDPATTAGTISIDIYRDILTNYPPVLADSIIGAGTKPTLTAATNATQPLVSGWTSVSLLKGDILRFNVEAGVALVKSVTLILGVTRT